MLTFVSEATWTTLLAYLGYAFCDWQGFEFMAACFAVNFVFFAAVTIGALVVWPMVWAVKHVRITIV